MIPRTISRLNNVKSEDFNIQLPRVTVVTHSPSPYQVELFDEAARMGSLQLSVIYLHARDKQRLWQTTKPFHDSILLTDPNVDVNAVARSTDEADLLVLNYYKHPFVKHVLQRRKRIRKPMCFWGERPLLHSLSPLSGLFRMWRLRAIHLTHAPIWGIGSMAVTAYRREFGSGHEYVNIPYFSNLEKFGSVPRSPLSKERVFLFSGMLCHRKGTDLLAHAFARLAAEFNHVRLRVVGYGPMEAEMKEQLSSLSDRVDFTGFCPWDRLHLEYAKGDILCVPSRHDGWGLVVPEGLAAGLPVVSTIQTGAAVEFIKPGHNGWLHPPGEGEGLYRSMRLAATLTDEQWHDMSHRARISVAQHSLQRGAAKLIESAIAAMPGRTIQPKGSPVENFPM
ncbi:glycosyltransferase family 4 protein [Roseimicrobium gellanilyticum]|uniref:glycosyltransferase family 4 protein n=1 Tax=Roseimicrobium gellanilyticum TaxID=748857 RepID=UPI001B86A4FB|nr:glycosyltransferase family 4 protein [Roseimicrobium gellanilyticum]